LTDQRNRVKIPENKKCTKLQGAQAAEPLSSSSARSATDESILACYKSSASRGKDTQTEPALECGFLQPSDSVLLVKFSAQRLHRVEHELKRQVAHFEHTQVGLGIAHLETEPVLFVFKTPVTEIELSVTLNFNFKFVTAGSDEAEYWLHDLNLRCEPFARQLPKKPPAKRQKLTFLSLRKTSEQQMAIIEQGVASI
jgi:hypothetical protein